MHLSGIHLSGRETGVQSSAVHSSGNGFIVRCLQLKVIGSPVSQLLCSASLSEVLPISTKIRLMSVLLVKGGKAALMDLHATCYMATAHEKKGKNGAPRL